VNPDQVFDKAHGNSNHKSSSIDTDAIFNAAHNTRAEGLGSYLWSGTKQIASGVVEGAAGATGLGLDLLALTPFGAGQMPKFRKNQDGEIKRDWFPYSRTINGATTEILPEPETEDWLDRYGRTAGQFVGGNLVIPGMSLGKQILTGLAGGIGAEGAEQLTGDDTIAPIVGGVAGGMAPSLLGNVSGMARNLFRGATPQEIKGSAALAMKESTGVSADDISKAIALRPDDDMGRLMSTAEVTDDAGFAQLEQTLAAKDEPARLYAMRDAARNEAREAVLDSGSSTQGVNKEGLGTALISRAKDVKTQMGLEAENLWAGVPRNVNIDISNGQRRVLGVVNSRKGGLPLDRKVRILADQFLDAKEGTAVSGALQDTRSDALHLLREGNLMPHEVRVLNSIRENIDKAMEHGFGNSNYSVWEEARSATAKAAEIFARGRAGGALTEPMAKPYRVLASALKGDTRSIEELRQAIRSEPKLLEDVKRGYLDMVPRDTQGRLTANNMKKFLSANEGGVKELFGEDYYRSLSRVLEDLRSQAKVNLNANLASKGNSVTAQRQTVAGAIDDLLSESLVPGAGPLAHAAEMWRRTIGLRDKVAVRDLVFKAAIDPEFALELAKTPSTERIFNTLERLGNTVRDMTNAGSRSIYADLARTPSSEQQTTGVNSSTPGSQVIQEKRGNNQLPSTQTQESAKRSYSIYPEGRSENTPAPEQTVTTESLPTSSKLSSSPLQNDAQQKFSQPSPFSLFTPSSLSKSESRASLYRDVFGGSMSAETDKEAFKQIKANPYYHALALAESGLNPKAKNPKSTAKGLFQFVDATAKSLGVKNPYDVTESWEGIQRLTNEHAERFGTDDPVTLYAAHFLGGTLLSKVNRGLKLSAKEQRLVDEFRTKALPNFVKNLEGITTKA